MDTSAFLARPVSEQIRHTAIAPGIRTALFARAGKKKKSYPQISQIFADSSILHPPSSILYPLSSVRHRGADAAPLAGRELLRQQFGDYGAQVVSANVHLRYGALAIDKE